MGERPKMRPLSEVLAQFPGCHVAVDALNEPKVVARDPMELVAEIRRRGLLNSVAVVYARYPDELELVGLG